MSFTSRRGRGPALVAAVALTAGLLPLLARAQGTVLRGIVQDESGRPLAKVKVILLDPERGTSFETSTNKKGEFMQVGIPASAYRATFALEGYVPKETSITVKLGMEEKALIVLKKVPARMEEDGDFGAGIAAFQEGRFEEAVAAFLKVRERFPDRVEPYYNLGVAYIRLGRPESAIESLETAVRLSPGSPEPYLALGEGQAAAGANDKALDAFAKAASLAPESARAHYSLGLAYYKADRTDEALACFETAVKIDPGNAAARYQAGLASIKKGDVAGALRHLEAFLELAPDRPESPQVRAMVEELKKR